MSRDPREEAERLVVAGLAALSMAAQSTAGFATGSAECCVCPVCKAIAAVRDPDPQFAERLATGVGDLAMGMASILRAFGSATAGAEASGAARAEAGASGEAEADAGAGASGDAGNVWQSATTGRSAPEPDDRES